MAASTTASAAPHSAFPSNHARDLFFKRPYQRNLEIAHMKNLIALALTACVFAAGLDAAPAAAEMRCRMEKQCRWVDFKKVCTYVRVCRER
jgi:hypothetical protein